MKRFLQIVVCAAVLVSTVSAGGLQLGKIFKRGSGKQNKPPVSHMPPIIDRQLIFGNPEIAAAQLSPDGKYLAFLKPWKDTRNVWVKTVDQPFDAARLLTTETKRPIAGYFWSRDSRYILYVKDKDGDENFNVYSVDPAVQPSAGADAPASRDLTGLKGVRVEIFDVPKREPDIVYIGLNDRDKSWHDLYKLRISTGEKTLVHQNTERITGWTFDLTGQARLATRSAENGDTEILRVDQDKLTKVYSCSLFEVCSPIRFNKDGKRIYMETNKGDSDLVSLVLFNPATGQTDMVESDPLKRVDFDRAEFSEATDELVETSYYDEKQRRYFHDKNFESDYKWLEGKLPEKEIDIQSSTLDEKLWLVLAHGDTEPGEAFLFDRNTHRLNQQYRLREKLPRESLSHMTAIHYESSDGLEIPAYLTLPKGAPAKGLPAVILPHGGPWGRDLWGYNSLAQFFANRGYVVLEPNFRGSTGYGKKFLDAGNLEWGRKMQDDLTWGVKYLITKGIADPKKLGILGGSYGGYATLAGVAFTPDVYAAAVDIVGPSNLITLLDSIPPYWEADRKVMYARMGDPTTPEGKTMLTERSPLNSAGKIKTPLLIAQGANDPRVNRREAEQIVIALRDRGFPVEYLLAPDEGHGFARPINNMALFMEAEKFLAKNLGGRYQTEATTEVTARLNEITVDPKTVVVATRVNPGVPKVAVDLQPGTYKYKATLSMGGQQMALSLATTIEKGPGGWTATEVTDTPMGLAKDTATLEEGTLIMRKRSVQQGPANISIDFTSSKATGVMNMNGMDKPISVDLDGPLFGDAPGAMQVIACLPLTEGYTTAFRNFDVLKQKEEVEQLKVAGVESITVPAGTFDAYKVELSSSDGGTDSKILWIAKDSRKPVKISEVLASMGGATLTAELMP